MLTARQQHCLNGIGIDVWTERRASSGKKPEAEPVAEILTTAEMEDIRRFAQIPEPAHDLPLANISSDEDNAPLASASAVVEAPVRLDSWDSIIAAIEGCNACELAQNCTRKVPGVGSRQADLLIIGEGPGHDEDIRGEPFVGRSGQLLDRMLAAIGFAREQVYITNIVKCRPPNNRDPKQLEAQQCRAFLEAQIAQLAPKVILSVGRVSAHNLLASNLPVGKLIQQMHKLPGTEIPLKVTYHPAYLLRNPSAKAIVWQDLKLLHQMLQ
jgi:DNA polymerase